MTLRAGSRGRLTVGHGQQSGVRRVALAIATLALCAATLIVIPPSSAGAHVEDGFEDVVVADVNGPTDLDWTPDGRMLVTGKLGQLWVIEDGVLVSTPAIDLSPVMCINGERALGSVAVHPAFETNHFIYLYYTFNKNGTCDESETVGPVNRFSRFVLGADNLVDPASETVLFDTPPLYRDHHNGGDIIFGPDGFIYVTVGDGGTRTLDRPQDPSYLLGKIVRVTDSGEIPPGNPYSGPGTARCNLNGVPPAGSPDGTACQEVYAKGLRNPFRFAVDPASTTPRFMINDVGQSAFEEINELTTPGTDFGWPTREGPCVFDAVTECDPPPPGLADPVHWYPHGIDGGAVTAGAFVPAGVWPPEYDGAYLYADYVFGQIYRMDPGGPECRSCSPPTSAFDATEIAHIPQIVSMAFGPHQDSQSLYYVTREGDGVHRIDYVGSANRAPNAVASSDLTAGPIPLTVHFDASASSDPDADPIEVSWDFDGDGSTDSTLIAPSFTYTTAGTYLATLVVTDDGGLSSSDTVLISAGSNPPQPQIDTPAEGDRFRVGETLTLTGAATDPDEALGDSAMTWEVRQHHAQHWHPFMEPTTGNDLTITAPEPEDFLAATNSYLEVRLTATDSEGVSATISRIVQPETVDLTFESSPSGLDLVLDGFTITTPATVVSWADYSLPVTAPDQLDAAGGQWNWSSWSDGGAQSHQITVPDATATYTAEFEAGQPPISIFGAVSDATIRENRPDRNLGDDLELEADAQPVKNTLVKFDVAGTGGRPIASAKLRLFVTGSSPDGGTVYLTENSDWIESTVTWNNAPAPLPTEVSAIGDADSGTWVEADVTQAVLGDGVVSLRLSSQSANGVDYASREDPANRGPQLVVEFGEPAGPDEQAPTPPTGLVAVADTPTEIELTWNASSDNVGVAGYDIFRCDGPPSPWGAPCTDLLTQVGTITAYEDTTVTPDSSYTYEVRARDAAGNLSTESNAATATTPPPDNVSPSMPSGLAAEVIGTSTVRLTWLPSTDNVEMGGYFILRDDARLPGSTTDPEYTDSSAAAGATHSYRVVAFDSSGNESAPSEALSVDVPPLPTTRTFGVMQDTTLKESQPDDPRGDRDVIEVDASSRKDGLLQFELTDVETVARAVIRLFVVDSSSSGGDFYLVTDNSWTEQDVTWNTAPPGDGGLVASVGDVAAGTWIEVDVTSVVSGDGLWSFRIESDNSNGVDYASKEHASGYAPELVVEMG